MKGELLFKIRLPWEQTLYDPLKAICVNHVYCAGMTDWVFRYSDIKKVEGLTGKSIEIPEYRDNFSKSDVEVPKFKGKDFIEIIPFPKIYRIITHQKQEDGSVKQLTHDIDREKVNVVWTVISRQPLNKPVKSSTVSENICKELGIVRFNRESGSFDFQKFFGLRKAYWDNFYYPIKVLAHQGKVKHHKKGMVERII